MKEKKVFILSPHILLTRAVEILLTGRGGCQIVGMETRLPEGLGLIHSLRPDVVILGNDEGSDTCASDVWSVFKADPGAAVIGLAIGDNSLHVYQNDQVTVANVEDLVQAINGTRPRRPRRRHHS